MVKSAPVNVFSLTTTKRLKLINTKTQAVYADFGIAAKCSYNANDAFCDHCYMKPVSPDMGELKFCLTVINKYKCVDVMNAVDLNRQHDVKSGNMTARDATLTQQ